MSHSTSQKQPHPRAAPTKRGMPALDISGPRTLGLAATLALFALITASAIITVPTGPMTTTRGRIQAAPIAMQHADGGVVARVHVKAGTEVEAGALIATLDTRLIDSQIAGLKRQMDGIQLHISGLKQEADALAASERQSTLRQRLAGLEAQIATSEQEGIGLEVRLAMAEQERKRTDIRAPLRGRIVKVAVADMTSVPQNGVIAEIQPAADRLVLEATWTVADARHALQGHPVSVWLGNAAPWSPHLAGRVEQVLTEATTPGKTTESRAPDGARVRLRISADLGRLDPTEIDRLTGERDFTLQLVSGAPSLLSLLTAPLTGASPSSLLTQEKVKP